MRDLEKKLMYRTREAAAWWAAEHTAGSSKKTKQSASHADMLQLLVRISLISYDSPRPCRGNFR